MKKNLQKLRPLKGFLFLGIVVIVGTFIREKPFDSQPKDLLPTNDLSKYSRPLFLNKAKEMGVEYTYKRDDTLDPLVIARIDTLLVAPGIAVADFNKDGNMDFFIPASGPNLNNHLYLSLGGRSFVESAAKWKISTNNSGRLSASGATVFDYNNDGYPDLLINGLGCSHLYLNSIDHFKDVSKSSGIQDCENSYASYPYDLDGDGLLDIYTVRYWANHNYHKLPHSKVFINNLYNADNGGINSSFIQISPGKFKRVANGAEDGHWGFDAVFADLNGDSKTDLYIANDYGPDQIYEINNGKFIKRDDFKAFEDRRYGMNTSLIDLGDANPWLIISNGFEGPPWGLAGNFLWHFENDRLKDHAFQKNVMNCGFAWGVFVNDFDLDGDEDFYMANGFISSSTPQPKNLERSAPKINKIFGVMSSRTLPGEMTKDLKNWYPYGGKTAGISYKQNDCLFINQDNKNFVNVSSLQEVDPEMADSRAVAGIDIENDGAMDLIVSSRDAPLKILRNQTKPLNNWIGFNLSGSAGNRDAVGSRLVVKQNGKTYTEWGRGGRGGFLASSDPRFHFGLKFEALVDLEITWPNGFISQHKNLKPGSYYDISQGGHHH